MTLRHLKIFVTVYREMSITKAADLLHPAQPSVSLAVRELEEYYGIRLFDRMSRRFYLTEEGRRFYDYALHITSLFDDMEKGIRNWDSLGSLRIGASIAIGTYLMPAAVERFCALHSDVKMSVLIKNSSGQIRLIPFMDDRLGQAIHGIILP